MLRYFMQLFLLGGVFHHALAQDNTVDPIKLLHEVDQTHRAKSSFAEVTMTIENPDWTRTLKMEAWSLGTKFTLIRILSPAKDRGVSTLRRNLEMWNYFPKINREIKVPPSMMMGSWMGSDFTNDDLVKQSDLADEYQVTLETLPKKFVLTLIPKQNTATVWGKIIIHVNKKYRLPLKEVFYDENETKVRELIFSENTEFSGKLLPRKMEMVSIAKPKHKTTVYYDKLKLNAGLKESFFSLHNLKKAKR